MIAADSSRMHRHKITGVSASGATGVTVGGSSLDVAVMSRDDAGFLSIGSCNLPSAVSCVTLTAPSGSSGRPAAAADEDERAFDAISCMPPLADGGLSQARSTLHVSHVPSAAADDDADAGGRCGGHRSDRTGGSTGAGLRSSKSATEMMSLLLSAPVAAAADASAAAKTGATRHLLQLPSFARRSPDHHHRRRQEEEAHLKQLADAYEIEKRRKRACRSRIIEL